MCMCLFLKVQHNHIYLYCKTVWKLHEEFQCKNESNEKTQNVNILFENDLQFVNKIHFLGVFDIECERNCWTSTLKLIENVITAINRIEFVAIDIVYLFVHFHSPSNAYVANSLYLPTILSHSIRPLFFCKWNIMLCLHSTPFHFILDINHISPSLSLHCVVKFCRIISEMNSRSTKIPNQ